MYESITERTDVSTDNDAAVLVHVEDALGWAEERESLISNPAYAHCEGSWAEFVGDSKMYFARLRCDISDRTDDVGEWFNGKFRRNRVKEA